MSLKLSIKSLDRRFLLGILVLIFLLIFSLSDIASSQESQATREVLRKASLRWMQVGINQYERNQFSNADLSFRRARVFKKYLTAAEREQLDELQAKLRIAESEGKQASAITPTADEPVTAAANVEKVEAGRLSTEQGLDKISSQPSPPKNQSIEETEPIVSNIQLAAESSNSIVVEKKKSFDSQLMRLSSWLSENRRNILIIGLPILAVLIFISKLQTRRIRPGRRVYRHHVPESSSFIGSRLSSSGENSRAVKNSKNARSASAAENPKRKSFTQSTEHWKNQHANKTPADGKPFRKNENRPQKKDKFKDDKPAVAESRKKQCTKCGETKALSDFHKDKSSKDGLARWCKECKAAAAREYRNRQAAVKK